MAAIVSLNPPPRQWLFEACLKPTEGVWSHPACMLVRRLAVRAKSGGGPLQNSSRARGPSAVAPAFWSAPAERSGDGAFARTRRQRTTNNCRPLESGVALRFPPQSKTLRAHAGNRLSRERLGLRRQSAAATALSHAPDANEPPTILVRSKAAWRFASRRSPRRFAHTRATAFRASVLECAGRAQRRRRFRAHQTPTNYQQLSSARKRRGALLPAAVQDASRTREQPPFARAFWSAPAERSDDGAFARTRRQRTTNKCRPLESGVALRFPPQSKTLRAHASNRLSRERFGVRRQSAATTALSRAPDANELPTIVVRSKAAWCFASRRSPRRFAHTRATAFRASVLECAGRARRRRRFRAH